MKLDDPKVIIAALTILGVISYYFVCIRDSRAFLKKELKKRMDDTEVKLKNIRRNMRNLNNNGFHKPTLTRTRLAMRDCHQALAILEGWLPTEEYLRPKHDRLSQEYKEAEAVIEKYDVTLVKRKGSEPGSFFRYGKTSLFTYSFHNFIEMSSLG